ncbi:MAG: 3-deoxy-D-manno-octulosonic acid kinase [Wenzhouxiangella sp.]|nr:3-deoxy-D-manno-octulosonic acid kinase [Wenzhouxiangella sp.]MCH8479541.1 3-deoxy-D-manno-octulosonic acid kinase [Wenzhouxiangella sp.]
MRAAEFQAGRTRILYDADRITAVSLECLQPAFWQLRGAVLADLGGRGQALAVQTEAGQAVLRRFLRGGVAARLSRDRYIFTGYRRSRPFREWQVLVRLAAAGLPVPRPLMASCERSGLSYRGALLSERIPDALPLSQLLGVLTDADWLELADTLSRFFAAGLIHADLNPGNLLRDSAGRWYLLDFDRARIVSRPVSGKGMVGRLERALLRSAHYRPGQLSALLRRRAGEG